MVDERLTGRDRALKPSESCSFLNVAAALPAAEVGQCATLEAIDPASVSRKDDPVL